MLAHLRLCIFAPLSLCHVSPFDTLHLCTVAPLSLCPNSHLPLCPWPLCPCANVAPLLPFAFFYYVPAPHLPIAHLPNFPPFAICRHLLPLASFAPWTNLLLCAFASFPAAPLPNWEFATCPFATLPILRLCNVCTMAPVAQAICAVTQDHYFT